MGSANGMVIPGTPISIDLWRSSVAKGARLFFLTHLHADHMQGLTNSWRFPIYTSTTNAALLKLRFKFSDSIVNSMEVGETYQIPLDLEDDHIMSVTVLDANHVPGAVMFLFQGYFGNYLYCGDMRWYPELLDNPVLKGVVELRDLDCIFLDNTYSAPHCNFPSREDAKKAIFNVIDSSPNSEIKIGVRSLGKEALLEAIAYRYQERILVTQEKLAMLKALRAPDVYTTDPKKARIHALPMGQITTKAHYRWNEKMSTVSILLTSLYVGWPSGPYSSSANRGLHVVPYSDHSSYPELMEMVGALAPRHVAPIVRTWSNKGWWSEPSAPDQTVKWDMSVYDHLLTTPPPDYFTIPRAVEEIMKPTNNYMLYPKVRHCVLRRGLIPKPKRAKRLSVGVVFSSPEPPPQSRNTASISIDMSDASTSSTPTHTSYPMQLIDAAVYSNEMNNHFTPIKASDNRYGLELPKSPAIMSASTQTPSCKLCIHRSGVKVKDRTTQTPLPIISCKRKQTECDESNRIKKMRKFGPLSFTVEGEDSKLECPKISKVSDRLKELRHKHVVAGRTLICEVREECERENNDWQEILKKSKSLYRNLKLINKLI